MKRSKFKKKMKELKDLINVLNVYGAAEQKPGSSKYDKIVGVDQNELETTSTVTVSESSCPLITVKFPIHLKVLYKVKKFISRLFNLKNCYNCNLPGTLNYTCVVCEKHDKFKAIPKNNKGE